MESEDKIWNDIFVMQEQYNKLALSEIKNYDKFFIYSIIANSTAIEGSTLTEEDTQLLFDEDIVAKGKPMTAHLMNLDLKAAYEYASVEATKKRNVTVDFLKQLNSLVMKNTGGVYNVSVGAFDSSTGDYRLCNMRAGFGGKSYMDYRKIPDKTNDLCKDINKQINTDDLRSIYNLSFDVHFDLVTIHPWIDGNGMTSRLLMNYLQFYHGVVPTKVHIEDRAEYIESLIGSREVESVAPFRNFMAQQHLKTLKKEIDDYSKSQKQTKYFTMLI
jgi:Fic family protein